MASYSKSLMEVTRWNDASKGEKWSNQRIRMKTVHLATMLNDANDDEESLKMNNDDKWSMRVHGVKMY